MIRFYRRTKQDKKLKVLPEFRVGSWVVVEDPSEQEIRWLASRFGLDPDVLRDALDPNEVPRAEFEDGKTYVILKALYEEELGTLLIVLGEQFILTLARRNPPFIEEMIASGEAVTTQRLKTLIRFLALNDREFESVVTRVVKEVQSRRLLETEKGVNELLAKESFLNSIVSIYYATRIVYTRLMSSLRFYEEDRDVLESVMRESEERYNLSKNALKTVSNMREYALILASNKLNRIISVLTVLTIMLSIPAAVSGVYGMNIALPAQHDPNAFWYIMALLAVMWACFWAYVKKKGLL